MNLSWENVQRESSGILLQGLNHLNTSELCTEIIIPSNVAGNYLIFENSKPIYIGQSLDMSKRLKQHLKSKKFIERNVSFKTLASNFGRKEIEEYGCYYFKELENKFHHHRIFNNSNDNLISWQLIQEYYESLLQEAVTCFEKKNQ